MMWIGYIIFGILLFVFMIYAEDKYNLTKGQNIIFSIIYMLIVAGFFLRLGIYSFNENIFMIMVVELFCQLVYINYFLDKDFFNKEDRYVLFYMLKIILAFFINQELINKVSDVFLAGDSLKVVVWFFIFLYLYEFFKKRDNSSVSKKEIAISKESIVLSFTKLKLAYGEDIPITLEDGRLVFYAIMIFNNYKRPKFFRKWDNILFKFNNKPRKLGIMQIMSKKYINDYESIISASKKIEKLFDKGKNSLEVINLYDKDNAGDIYYIYLELQKFCKL